jgi:hypothetical protein
MVRKKSGFKMLRMGWSDISGLNDLDRALSKLASGELAKVGSRALNRAGDQGRTKAGRALARQTGLKLKTVRKAMQVSRASAGTMEYQIRAKGGDISLSHFNARETRKGLSATPFGHRKIFSGVFIHGGKFPARKPLKMGGKAFRRSGDKRLPIKDQRSGVVLPEQMVKDESAKAWGSTVGVVLPARLKHELNRATGGIFR